MSEEKAIERLGEKIDGLKKDIAAQDTVAAVMTAQLSTAADDRVAIKQDVKEIRTWILGNGDPEGGLSGKVKVLERVVEKWKETQTWFVRLVISGVILALIGFAVNYYFL